MEPEDPDSAKLEANMEDPITVSLGPMNRLLRRLGSFEASQQSLPRGVNQDMIQKLQYGLEELYTNLKIVPEAEDPSFTPKWWIKEVRELCYDTEDYFDDAMQSGDGDGAGAGAGAGVRRSARLRTIFRIIRKRKRWPQTAKDLDFSQLMVRVDDARERYKCFHAPEAIRPDSGQAGVSCLTPKLSLELSVSAAPISVHVDTSGRSIVGVEESMKKLDELLALDGDEKKLKVIPIFGFAGVGKTTLARTLYHKYGGKFQCRAFVRVSRNPVMRRILTSVLSQIKAPRAHAFSDAQDLIDSIIKHLQGKRYFIIIDDLWAASVWDIISRGFPSGDCCSRIITTTQIEDVALACCRYQSEYIFKMGPLNDGESRKLFFNRVFGSEGEGGCPKDFEKVTDGIIRKCGGLALSTVNVASLLQTKPNLVMEQWENVLRSLPSTLGTNPTSEGMIAVLILIYNKLPLHLKTCLLYLSMYPEGSTVRKDDLVKQWVAEGFVDDTEHVARVYFDELVRRGMIQPVDTNYHGEVLSCTVNHMVLDLIRYKSMEDNFIIPVDYFDSTPGLADKVRRLSVQFGGAKSAKIPESIRMSQVRSLLFCGFFKFGPSIVDYRHLRVLILHIWADQDKTSFDLTRVGELSRLRYLKIECNITVDLPDKIQGLQYLGTLQVDAKLSAVPSDIGHLKKLLHICLPSEVHLPNAIGHMTSLRTLGYFDLSSNSTDNVINLGELTNLQDLQLACSTVQPADNLEDNMKCLGSILGKLRSLRCLTLIPANCSHVNTADDAGASSMSIFCDGLNSVSPAPALLEKLELLPRICISPCIPKWFGDLDKLCILKIAVRELSTEDIDILERLHALTALSLYVWIAPTGRRIVFGEKGFTVVRYFKFTCTALCLAFAEGAMPNAQRLRLRFNANGLEQYDPAHAGFEHLLRLEEISAKIGNVGADECDSKAALLTNVFRKHPIKPIFNIQSVDRIYNGDREKSSARNEEKHQTAETQDAGVEVRSNDQNVVRTSMPSGYVSHMQDPEQVKNTVTEPQGEIGVDVSEPQQFQEKDWSDSKIPEPSKASSHPQSLEQVKKTVTEPQGEIGVDVSEPQQFEEKDWSDSKIPEPSKASSHPQSLEQVKNKVTEPQGEIRVDVSEPQQFQEKDWSDSKIPEPSKASSHPQSLEQVKNTVTEPQWEIRVDVLEPQQFQEKDWSDSKIPEPSKASFHPQSPKQVKNKVMEPQGEIRVDFSEPQQFQEKDWSDCKMLVLSSASSHPQSPDESITPEDEEPWYLEDQHGIHEMNKERDKIKQFGARTLGLPDSSSFLIKPGRRDGRRLVDSLYYRSQLRQGMIYMIKQLGVIMDLRFIQREMELMAIIIEENKEQDLTDKWVLQLQELVYDIEDFKYFRMIYMNIRSVLSLYINSHQLVSFLRYCAHMSHTERLKGRIKSLRKWQHAAKSSQIGDSSGTPGLFRYGTHPHCYARQDDLIGIREPTEELVLKLLFLADHRRDQTTVISIVGCSGLGKSTLAAVAYNDYRLRQEFQYRAWVVASECNNAGDLLNEIFQQFDPRANKIIEYSELTYMLQYSRCLVVIDQLERAEVWYDIKRFFPKDSSTRIILTTTIQSVAAATAIFSSSSYLYTMRRLGSADSKKLFWRQVYGSDDTEPAPALVYDSENILRKCDGLPLALLSAANYVQRHHQAGRIRRFGNYQEAFGEMNRSFVHCYNSLPDNGHRTCLLSLSIFPHGHQINRKSLIRRWVAEELVAGDAQRTAEEVACDRFDELIDRNIIEPVLVGNNSKVRRCRVHGAMLEFIITKSISKNFVTLIRKDEPDVPNTSPHPVRRLSVQDDTAVNGRIPTENGLSVIRSLTIFKSKVFDIQSCMLLRVLDLEGCKGLDDIVLDAVCQLMFLKYLSLRGSDVRDIPKRIRRLHYLETLDIRETEVNQLPIEVIILPRLAHLFGRFELSQKLSDSKKKSKLQKFLSKKSRLQTLSGITLDSESLVFHMRFLRKVKIWYSTDEREDDDCFLQKLFTGSNALESVSIDVGNHFINFYNLPQAFYHLSSIKLRGKLLGLPDFVQSVHTLSELQLSSTGLSSEKLSVLQNLRCLLYLKLSEDHPILGGGMFEVLSGGFPSLERLCFEGPELPQLHIEKGAMTNLTSLHLLCPVWHGICGMETLQRLNEVVLHHSVDAKTLEAGKKMAMQNENRPKVTKQFFLKKKKVTKQATNS